MLGETMTEQDPPDGEQPANPYGAPSPGGSESPYGQPAYGTPPPSGQPYGTPPPYGQPYAPPPAYGQPAGYGPGYGPAPIYGAGYGTPATDGTAIAALILAISSFVICPVIPAIIALVLAGNAKRTIAASGGAKTGEGMVTAARVIAWINIAVAVVAIIGLIAVAAVGRTSVSTGS